MGANLNIGVDANWRVPGTYIKTVFGAGESIATAGQRYVMYVMPMLGSGTWQANQPVLVSSEDQAITGAGEGSVMHRALRKHFQTVKRGRVYALPFAPTSGGGTSADGYMAFSGTASNTGALEVEITDQSFTVVYPGGTTADALGELVEARILALGFLPCTAVNTAGSVALTAKTPGASQNGSIRFRARFTAGSGLAVAVSGSTLGSGFGVAGSDGSTTEQANFEDALDTIQARYYYLVSSYGDSTKLGLLKAKLIADADPLAGRREQGIGASTAAYTSAITVANALNYERLQIVSQPFSDCTPEELAASMAAIRSYHENSDSAASFSTYRGGDSVNWTLPAVHEQASWLTPDEQNDLLVNGVTPIASDQFGTYVVKSVNTASKDATGLVQDLRKYETHRISVVDEFADVFSNRHSATYAGKNFKLMADPVNADGTPDYITPIPAKVVTPNRVRGMAVRLIDEFSQAAKIKNPDAAKAALEVQISDSVNSRIEMGVSLDVVDLYDQITVKIQEVSKG